MGRNTYDLYLLEATPKTVIFTSTKNRNTLALLNDLGFQKHWSIYCYSLMPIRDTTIYSVPEYFKLDIGSHEPEWAQSKHKMLRLVRISNGTEQKIREIYKEICDAKVVAGKRWWEHYCIKK